MTHAAEHAALAYLRELGEELASQPNYATNAPMYQVLDYRSQVVDGETITDVEVKSTFFTEKAAKEYIAMKGGKLQKPTIYVDSGFENPEWLKVRELAINLHNESQAA